MFKTHSVPVLLVVLVCTAACDGSNASNSATDTGMDAAQVQDTTLAEEVTTDDTRDDPMVDASDDAQSDSETMADAPTDVPSDLSPDMPPDAPSDTNTFNDDVAIGPRQNLAEGFHVTPTYPDENEPFSMIIASDPQIWWNFIDSAEGPSDEEVEAQNMLHVEAMNVLLAGERLPEGQPTPRGVIMNGDLTEYGRWAQWDAYYRIFEQVNAPLWDGLGNHDYENNNSWVSSGCNMQLEDLETWQAACESSSAQTVWGEPACQVFQNVVDDLWGWCAADSMRRMRYWLANHADYLFDYDEGSAAYSWEIGDIHFIQLHNFADYEVPQSKICSAIPWLKNDLRSAFVRGKKIVINLHKPINNVLKSHFAGYEYNIIGIFYGHIHRNAGYTADYTVNGIAIPEFYSGSVEWNLFSFAYFDDTQMTVTVVDSNTGVPVHHANREDYTNINGARIADPFTYVYPTHACPTGQIPDGIDGPCIVPELETLPIELCYD